MSVSFETYEDIMKEWDAWRSYIANGGGGSWPRDAFESLLQYFEDKEKEAINKAYEKGKDDACKCQGCGCKVTGTLCSDCAAGVEMKNATINEAERRGF